jgi:hypothetical protein
VAIVFDFQFVLNHVRNAFIDHPPDHRGLHPPLSTSPFVKLVAAKVVPLFVKVTLVALTALVVITLGRVVSFSQQLQSVIAAGREIVPLFVAVPVPTVIEKEVVVPAIESPEVLKCPVMTGGCAGLAAG